MGWKIEAWISSKLRSFQHGSRRSRTPTTQFRDRPRLPNAGKGGTTGGAGALEVGKPGGREQPPRRRGRGAHLSAAGSAGTSHLPLPAPLSRPSPFHTLFAKGIIFLSSRGCVYISVHHHQCSASEKERRRKKKKAWVKLCL